MKEEKSFLFYAVLLLAAAIILGTVYLLLTDPTRELTQKRDSTDSEPLVAGTKVIVWCVETSPYFEPLKTRITQYNESVLSKSICVELQGFSDEESMAVAMDKTLPDIFISSYGRMRILSDAKKLLSLHKDYPKPEYKTVLSETDDRIGKTIFPLGFSTDLLYCKKDTYNEPPKTLGNLFKDAQAYGSEHMKPFLYVQDYARLFRRAVRENGGLFAAEYDSKDVGYKSVYNYVGAAAYSYGIECGNYDPLQLISEGYVQCAIADSSYLKGLSLADYNVYNMPQAGARMYTSGELTCMAMTTDAASSSASAFISWLSQPERLYLLAIAANNVPVITTNQGSSGTIAKLLTEISDGSFFMVDELSDPYYSNKEEFNKEMERAIQILRS